jgi:signal transduction histidine kinase
LVDALLLPRRGPGEGVGTEAQALLVQALMRLGRQEGVGAAVAWALGREDEPLVLAAHPSSEARRIEPSGRLFDALGELGRVARLSDAHPRPELAALAARGVSAVAPIEGFGSRPAAVVLIFAEVPGRPLRPRAMAVLDEVTRKLGETMTTNLALARLERLDAHVRQLDRLATLGGLVAEIVHEVRNPLVSVKTFLQLLPDRLEDPEFHEGFRSLVGEEVQRLERMLDDLLRHARPASAAEPGDGGRLDAAIPTIQQLLAYRCRERGVELITQITADLPPLGLSEDALRQLLLNLLLNATEVTPEGDTIQLSADWSSEEPNHVELCIEDSGPGIDPALRAHVFEPFWTSRSEGVGGLGLAICKRIVEEAGGSIRLASGPGDRGASFRITLPIVT